MHGLQPRNMDHSAATRGLPERPRGRMSPRPSSDSLAGHPAIAELTVDPIAVPPGRWAIVRRRRVRTLPGGRRRAH